MSDRVVVFIDYQNVYRRARDAFFEHRLDPHWCGQVDPKRLGRYLAADSPFDRTLKEVRVYRGVPVNDRDRKGYAAARRQLARWERDDDCVTVQTRDLRYPHWYGQNGRLAKPEEKGIDVAIAVDFAVMGTRGEYDVGILFSVDTDLKPALEVVAQQQAGRAPRAEVAAWSGDEVGHKRRLSIAGRRLYCHWIDRRGYGQVCDETNYASGSEHP